MQNNWHYLDLPEFGFRQRMVVDKFNQHKSILEVGSFDRKLRTYFTEQYKGKIISCDPLIPKTIEFENGDIQFSGTLVRCSSFLNDKKIKVDGIVALGLNLAPLDADPEQNLLEFTQFIKMISEVSLYAIEYPIKFFPAKIESEMAMSLTLPKLITDETMTFNNPTIPNHANTRRIFIGAPTVKPKTEEIYTLFRNFRINSFAPELLFSKWKRAVVKEFVQFGRTYLNPHFGLIITRGKKWSYVANLGRNNSTSVAIRFYGHVSGLTLSSASTDSQTIHFEKRINGFGKLNLLSFSEPEDTLLIRYGNSGGLRFFVFRMYQAVL